MYSTILPAYDVATNSASKEDNTTKGCILDLYKTGAPSMKLKHPVTDFVLSPPQSMSTKALGTLA